MDVSPITGLSWEYILAHGRTAVFTSVVCFELLFVWNCRDEYHPVWRTEVRESRTLMGAVALSAILTLATIYFPPMAAIFQTVPINPIDWAVIILTCIPALLIPPHLIFGYFRKKVND
jgi:Ca2+-transporting ATPase